jgi:ferredoxin-NADP reductase
LYREELRRLAQVLDMPVVELHDKPLTTRVIADVVPSWSKPNYYICGLRALVSASVSALDELQIDEHRIHTERFAI